MVIILCIMIREHFPVILEERLNSSRYTPHSKDPLETSDPLRQNPTKCTDLDQLPAVDYISPFSISRTARERNCKHTRGCNVLVEKLFGDGKNGLSPRSELREHTQEDDF